MKKISKPERSFYLLAVIAAAGFILRLPSVRLGLPPHIFVDEIFFFDDTYRSLNSAFFFPQAFISGSINELPFWFMGKIFQLFGGGFSYSGFLIFGRILGPLALTALTVFPLYRLSINLTGSRLAATTSVVLFSCSPWVFANSQIWYPDHYIYFFVTYFLLQFSKMWNKQVNTRTVYHLAASFALLVSVKYSAAIYSILIFVAPYIMPVAKNESRKYYKNLANKSLVYSLPIFLVINFSIFRYFHGFLSGMNSNRRNYRFFSNWPFSNLLAYSELTFIFSLGFIGLLAIVLGFWQIRSADDAAFRVFSITIAAYLMILSTSPIMVPRNINLLIPLLAVIAGAGAQKLVILWKVNQKYSIAIGAIATLLAVSTAFGLVVNVSEVRRPDSFELAKDYINKNLPLNAVVGFNPGSDGLSPSQDLGLASVPDPEMKQGLKYYVFSSYWESPFRSFYNQRGFFRDWSYRNFHFNETSPESANIFHKKEGSVFANVPNGYKIQKVIKSVGPVFIILRKVSE